MIEIEVNTRMNDWWMDYTGGKGVEYPKYYARVKGKPGVWAAGKSQDEAIGDLIRCHPEHFGVNVKYLGKLAR